MPRIVESADVSDQAVIGDSSSIWHLAQVREDVVMGEGCIVGRGAYIGTGVVMGDNCKVQNYALVYEPARLGTAFSLVQPWSSPMTTTLVR